jgi:competence protein ComEA
MIFIDLEGAIERPLVYKMPIGSRIYQLLEKGVLTKQADKEYIAQNLNKSELLVDQEKVYIPSIDQVASNTIPDLLTFSSINLDRSVDVSSKSKVNINIATQAELESLSGIGATTATKIINGRPYENIRDLLSNKIVGQSIYDKISSDISTE